MSVVKKGPFKRAHLRAFILELLPYGPQERIITIAEVTWNGDLWVESLDEFLSCRIRHRPRLHLYSLRHAFEMGTVMRSALPLKQWLRVLASLALLVPIEAVAQSDPWVGRWGAGGCGPNEIEIVLSRSSLDLSTFETVCSVRSVRQHADVFDLDATCQGEGARKKRTTLSIQVRGNVLTFVGLRGIEFSPKRFERCGAQDSRGTEPPAPLPQSNSGYPLSTKPSSSRRRRSVRASAGRTSPWLPRETTLRAANAC